MRWIAVKWRDSGWGFTYDAGKGSSLELWPRVVRGWASKLGQSYVRTAAENKKLVALVTAYAGSATLVVRYW